MDDEAKRIILARRARFMAAALASLGIAAACESEQSPQPCLSFAAGGTEPAPGGNGGLGGSVIVPATGGSVGGPDAGPGGEGGMAGEGPLPCLPFIEPKPE